MATRLIAALDAELLATYPEDGATHFRLDPAEVVDGRGAFLVAYLEDDPCGCGAVRLLDGEAAEVKRMFVAPHARGAGVGKAILAALEAQARALGASRVVLETGLRQHAALTLYRRAGFIEIPAYGEYVGSPLSICFAKTL